MKASHVSLSGKYCVMRDCGIDRKDVLDHSTPWLVNAYYMMISNDQMVVTQKPKLAYFFSLEYSGGLDDDCMGFQSAA